MTKLLRLRGKLLMFAMLFSCIIVAQGQTPVEKYGQLKIHNGKVSDQAGNPVVLRGMSLFWSGYPEGSPYYNATTIQWLRDDWCIDVVRVAMSVETGNTNYVNNRSTEMGKVKAVIDACRDLGLYVIVDFHTHNAPNYKNQAVEFFTEIANTYGHLPNILYEPYNEPISQSWSASIKPYHNDIISTIRAIDSDNIIICGTRNYSQDVDEAANDPVTGTNVAYTLHYYAGSHGYSLRQKAINAMNKGVAIFVTEYGTCHASGNTGFNAQASQEWWDFLEQHQLSSCNWSVSNKAETASIIQSWNHSISGWSTNDLTQSGNLVRNYLKGKCNVVVTTGSINLSFAGDQVQYEIGETVTINATATVSNGSIAKMEFYSGSTLLGTDNTSPYSFTTSQLAAGGHNITAKTFDSNGNLIAVSPLYVITVVGNSNIATTGVTDQFETTTQYSEITGGVTGTSCANATSAAAAGVYWFEDRNASTPFVAEATRAGDGTLRYLITQPDNAYNVIGFSFGEYCLNGALQKYALNLEQNAILSITVATPETNTETLDLKFQLKDADGTVIAINRTVLLTDGTVDEANWYKHEIGFSKNHDAGDYQSLIPGSQANFTFDFRDALSVNNPENPDFPTDINNHNDDFDFTKVTEVIMIPLNIDDTGPTGNPAWAPIGFTNQEIIFSGLTLGDPALGTDICTTPPAPATQDEAYCQNATDAAALTATGIAGLTLEWYTSETGGVATETAPIPSTAVAGVATYYVSMAAPTAQTCEGPRTALDVTIVEAPVADAGNDQTAVAGPTVSLAGTGSAVGAWTLVSGPVGVVPAYDPSANSASVTVDGLSEIGTYTFSYTVVGDAICPEAVSDVLVEIQTLTATNALSADLIEMYPNPVSDKLHINMSKVDGSKSVKMVDMLGRVIFESSDVKSANIDMSGLNEGMYFIHIQSDSGSLVKSIIKE